MSNVGSLFTVHPFRLPSGPLSTGFGWLLARVFHLLSSDFDFFRWFQEIEGNCLGLVWFLNVLYQDFGEKWSRFGIILSRIFFVDFVKIL